jgi:hypothetical protein
MHAEQEMEDYLKERKLVELVDHLVAFLEKNTRWLTIVNA